MLFYEKIITRQPYHCISYNAFSSSDSYKSKGEKSKAVLRVKSSATMKKLTLASDD